MTPDELREAVARAAHETAKAFLRSLGFLAPAHDVPWDDAPDWVKDCYLVEADAALAVVREALRECGGTEGMRHLWRSLLAASPLGGGDE